MSVTPLYEGLMAIPSALRASMVRACSRMQGSTPSVAMRHGMLQACTPPPSEALKLLHSLAADRGIAAVMAHHRQVDSQPSLKALQ